MRARYYVAPQVQTLPASGSRRTSTSSSQRMPKATSIYAPSAKCSHTEAGLMWGITLRVGISLAASVTTAPPVERFSIADVPSKCTSLPRLVFRLKQLCRNWNKLQICMFWVSEGIVIFFSSQKLFLIVLKTILQTWRSTDKWRSSQCEAVQPSGNVVGAESKRAKEEIWGNTLRLYTSICACLATFAQQSIGQGTIDNTT